MLCCNEKQCSVPGFRAGGQLMRTFAFAMLAVVAISNVTAAPRSIAEDIATVIESNYFDAKRGAARAKELRRLAVPSLGPGEGVVIGPFLWTPVHLGDECMLMSVSSKEDRANNDPITGLSSAAGPTPAWRLVPSDNNIAMRSLSWVPARDRCALEAAFCNRKFWAQNPFAKPARMEIRAVLPPVLASRGWAMRFNNPGGNQFTLGAHDAREIRPVLLSGREISAADIEDADDVTIRVVVLANGIVVGGVSYALDPQSEVPKKKAEDDCKKSEPRDCCKPCIDDRCRCAKPECRCKPTCEDETPPPASDAKDCSDEKDCEPRACHVHVHIECDAEAVRQAPCKQHRYSTS
jgi:zinc metalloprotease ZmpB